METEYTLLFLCILCVLSPGVNSWFFSDTNADVDADSGLDRPADTAASLNTRSSPFEINTADEKFLLEASIAKDLSVLDACHHRVVSELEGRCSDLSEEELAKLSVHLFNCQAAVEKRQTYSCTSDMAIADCTRGMDPTTWNAYQIVSNRARSICYGVRQQHFRVRAELTVNRLMASSEQQLSTLATISETQEQLKGMADSTIEQLKTGHQQIAGDQQQLRQAHRIMSSQVLRNLQHIQQEKEVIITSNKQLLTKTEQIQQKLDNTAEQISEQTEVQSTRHKELLHDLAQLGVQAEDVSAKLDASTAVVENFQHNMIEQQLDAIENLKRINDTVNFLLSLMNSIHDLLEPNLEWIIHVTGATDSRVVVMSAIAAHISYAVVAILLFSFLHVAWYIRYLLITTILMNAAAELKFNNGFESTKLAAILLAVGFVAYFVAWCLAIWFHRSPPAEPIADDRSSDNANCHHSLSNEDIKYIVNALEHLSPDFKRRISGYNDQVDVGNVTVSSSTPIRHVPELGFEGLSNYQQARFALDCTPPRIRRLVLPATPHDPPPTPFVDEESLQNHSGILRLQPLESGSGTRPGSPASSASCSGTPRAARQRKSRMSSLNRSFNRSACTAVTKSGQVCKLPSQEGSTLCHRHQRD